MLHFISVNIVKNNNKPIRNTTLKYLCRKIGTDNCFLRFRNKVRFITIAGRKHYKKSEMFIYALIHILKLMSENR